MSSRQITSVDLAQFTGTSRYYKHWSRRIVYTDGVQFLAEQAGAYWLIDLIASYQPIDTEMQYWMLRADPAGFCAVCKDLDGVVLIEQKFEYSDFPEHLLPFTLYLQNGALYLPSED